MDNLKCNRCEQEFNEPDSLRKHVGRKHNINAEAFYKEYVLKNESLPVCKCGCGLTPKFISFNKGYKPYVNGHNSRVKHNNPHEGKPETRLKVAKTLSENWAKGMYKGWWEDDSDETRAKLKAIGDKFRGDKERGKKISEKLKGHKNLTEEGKKRISEKAKQRYIDRPELGKAISKRRLKYLQDNCLVKTSKLEETFEHMLQEIGFIKDVDYIRNYLIENIKTFFDFYFPKHNVIVETDGDFYHCNPNTHPEPIYEIQKKNLGNDKRKNSWASNHNIQLIRYWESDINEKPEWVIQDLKEKLGFD